MDGDDEDVDGMEDDVLVLSHAVQPLSATIAAMAERISAVFRNFIAIYLQVQFLTEFNEKPKLAAGAARPRRIPSVYHENSTKETGKCKLSRPVFFRLSGPALPRTLFIRGFCQAQLVCAARAK